MQLLTNQSILFWSGGWVYKPNEKRVENTTLKETRFQTRMKIFLICILIEQPTTLGDKQLYLITHFTKQTLNLNYLLLTLNVTEQFLKNPKQKRPFFF